MNKRPYQFGVAIRLLAGALGVFLTSSLEDMRGAEQANDANKSKPAWKKLSDGKSLAGWKEANFGGEGEIYVENGAIIMSQGNDMTGITYARDDFPKTDYEVAFEAKKVKGNDFFCTTTFPIGKDHCSLVVGGWGGAVVGLSSVDDKDASENETNSIKNFERNQWYRVRKVVNFATKSHTISIRPECDLCRPFGIATWRTVGAVRDIRVRTLGADETKTAR
jgi:hypothetical protein